MPTKEETERAQLTADFNLAVRCGLSDREAWAWAERERDRRSTTKAVLQLQSQPGEPLPVRDVPGQLDLFGPGASTRPAMTGGR